MIDLTGRLVTGGLIYFQMADLGPMIDTLSNEPAYYTKLAGPNEVLVTKTKAPCTADDRIASDNKQFRDYFIRNGIDPYTVRDEDGKLWFTDKFLSMTEMG